MENQNQQFDQQYEEQQIQVQQSEQQIYSQQVENQQQNYGSKNRKSVLLLVLLILLVTITIGYAVLSTSLNIVGTSTILSDWCVGLKCGENGCDDVGSCQNSPIVCPNNDCIITDCDKNPSLCNCNNNGECSGPTAIDCSQNPDKSNPAKCTCAQNGTCTPIAQVWLKGDSIYFRNILAKPGDIFTFDTTYKNGGTIDAKLESFSKSALNATAQQFMTYEVKYSDGSIIEQNETLSAGSSKTFRVTVKYNDVQTLPTPAQLDLINEVADGRTGATSTFTVNYVQK